MVKTKWHWILVSQMCPAFCICLSLHPTQKGFSHLKELALGHSKPQVSGILGSLA